MNLPTLERAVGEAGLVAFGAFNPGPEDDVPGDAGTVVLVGNAGPAMWTAFTAAVPASERARGAHPLNDWVRQVMTEIAGRFEAAVVFPFAGPPFFPFMRWALRAMPVFASPIGPLIHVEYGLWHAYRAALLLPDRVPVAPPPAALSPCQTCEEKPCLNVCPVDALGAVGYDVDGCVSHLATRAGADCVERGCRARRACPVGREYSYSQEQASFHMTRFRDAQTAATV